MAANSKEDPMGRENDNYSGLVEDSGGVRRQGKGDLED